MSWDVFIMRFPEELKSSEEIPADWVPDDLGTVGDIRVVIGNAIPDIEWRSNGWGRGSGPGYSVEVPLTEFDDEVINGVTLTFRGAGDAPYVAMAIAQSLSARALGSGLFLEPDNAENALGQWIRYRNQVIGPPPTKVADAQTAVHRPDTKSGEPLQDGAESGARTAPKATAAADDGAEPNARHFGYLDMGILRNALRRARAGSLEHDWRQRLVPTAAPIDGDSAYVHGELLAIEDVRYMPVAAWEPGKAAHWREALDRWYVASRNVLLAVYAYEFNQLLAMTQTAVELLSSDLDRRRQRDTAKPPLIAYLAEYTGTSDACHDELQQKALQRHIADRDELGALYRAGLAAGGEDWRWVEWYTARIENWADQASAERERQMLADPFRRAYYEQLPDYWMG